MASDPKPGSEYEQIFSQIYEKNYWTGKESRSGPGSDLATTQIFRTRLQFFLDHFKIQSMCDIPCGDFFWMKEINLGNIWYWGFDIVPAVIEENKKKYQNKNINFDVLNAMEEPCPKADLIFCKDLLLHLSNNNIKRALTNFKASGSTYLLINTIFRGSWITPEGTIEIHRPAPNRNLPETATENPIAFVWGRNVELMAPPFSLPEPLLVLPWNETGAHFLLWKLADIPSF